MPIATQTSTRFTDEIRSLPRWVFYLAALVLLAIPVLMVVVLGRDNHAPPFAVRCLLGAMMGVVLACYVLLIGYINQDAGRRRMSRLLWTLISIFVPNGLGIVLYFVLRKPRVAHCSQCGAEVEPGFSFCPRCRYPLHPVCPHCQHSVTPGDKFCPYCGGIIDGSASVPPPAAVAQP